MKKIHTALVGALALTCLALPQLGHAQGDPRIRAGKTTFVAVGCAGCHGYQGQGGIGPSTGPRIADLPAEAIIAIIRQPPEPMPYFSAKVLPDSKVAEIAAYLHSLPKPRDAAAIPLLAHAAKRSK